MGVELSTFQDDDEYSLHHSSHGSGKLLMYCGCPVGENDTSRCKNPHLHVYHRHLEHHNDSSSEPQISLFPAEQTSDVLGVGWTLSQLSSNRHYYQGDGEGEQLEKANTPSSQHKFNDFDSTCKELRPNKEGISGDHFMTHGHPLEGADLSDEEMIEKVMYQQCVLQYHLMMYHFPAPLPEFYEMYTRHIGRPFSELQDEFDLKLEHFILANYTFPPIEKGKQRESLLDQCNKFLDHCLQHR
ncbi:hypothetical protein FDP41_009357 [Naegleria fowleri]|uniref:Uncharacterized protein n=1 Tax=Naegleria fowleri TaxID=5763 RepID=A0A6A5BEJ2_NAEFO|nr:uncharacterized protein FDP41_009357 [Naegleria fowleri]KAF0972454.1 hypothetical protein FDP41_009357 [Naegleria fowleri]CAG4709412.1 unnamed protein product [Naegleria fowleri]